MTKENKFVQFANVNANSPNVICTKPTELVFRMCKALTLVQFSICFQMMMMHSNQRFNFRTLYDIVLHPYFKVQGALQVNIGRCTSRCKSIMYFAVSYQ